jgi:3-dehydrosphinganine reductase
LYRQEPGFSITKGVDMDFRNQHVIITGGSSGIGRAVASLLTQRGAHVSIIARRQELLDDALGVLEDLRVNHEQRLLARSADVADWDQMQETMVALTVDGYPPDLLINAAGIVHCGYLQESSMESFYNTVDVDLYGTVHAVKAALPMMMERCSGHIVNFSSVLGFMGSFGYASYCAAKFAVRGFSDVLRHEMKPYGIHVSVVFPQDTDTPQLHYERQIQPLEARRVSEGGNRILEVYHVAKLILRGIERRQAYILPGLEAKVSFAIFNGPSFLSNLTRWLFVDRVVARVCREREAQQHMTV